MRRLMLLALSIALLIPSLCLADTYVNGYTRRDGTYVKGHYRSDPDGVKWNNYGSSSRNSYGVYGRDSDGDGLWNQFDMDDDNDGTFDDFE